MADMTFKTNLLPKVATGETQSTYSLGSSTQRWKIYGSMPNTMRYATCSTAADTAAKEATIADGGPSFELVTGSVVFVKFTNSNNVANPTLNIGSTGTKSIICYGTTAPTTGVDTSWYAGAIITCIYDGTNWCLADFSSRGSGGSIDTSNFMVKGTDFVTAGNTSGAAVGTNSTVEGIWSIASANYAHAEGYRTTAGGVRSHTEGWSTETTGGAAHAEGRSTHANGLAAHAEGSFAVASGNSSHAEGTDTIAQRASQHVFGEYNIADTAGADGTERGTYVEIVGNGTADEARANARTLDWNGNETLAGKLTVGAAPTASMDVATKQYVDTAVAGAGGGGSVYEIEYVTYNSSTSAEIEAAYQDGKTIFVLIDDGQSPAQIYPLTERSSATSHTFIGYNPTVRTPVEINCSSDTWSTTTLPALPMPLNNNAGQVLQSNGTSWVAASMPRTWYGTSNTSTATTAKVVTCADYTLVKGSIIGILFTTANVAVAPTLNINSTGPISIYIGNSTPSATTNVLRWSANTVLYFMYDGTYYRYITSVAAGSIAQPRGANTWYGTSSTAAGTAAKTSSIDNYVLTTGSMVTIAFSTASTVANKLTLNINSTGAKDIWYNNTVTSATNPLYWGAKDVLTFIYDGTHYMCVNSPRQDNSIIRSTEDPTNASNYPANTIWIKYGADPMATIADYIVQTGTSDGVCFYRDSNDVWQSTTITDMWIYNIWTSGRAECWGTGQYSLPITQTWGSLYESKKLYAKYPSELFADDTHVMCQITPTSTSAVLLEVGSPDVIGETQQTPSFWLVRATANASTVTYNVNFYARGVSSST